jgi:CheY-like chemotaxis protein
MKQAGQNLVLVVDDYDDAAAQLAELLKCATPFDAMAARGGREALELAKDCRPVAAILDIDMPYIGGIEVARAMRDIFGERRPLLIALSGRASLDEVVLSGLFDHALRKPVQSIFWNGYSGTPDESELCRGMPRRCVPLATGWRSRHTSSHPDWSV